MFLGIYPFCPGCPVCWHGVVHNIFLKSFVCFWCQLLFLLFYFWFYFGRALSLFFLMSLVKDLSILFIFSNNELVDSSIFCLIYFFRHYLVYFCSDFYYFLSSTYLGVVCVSFASFFQCKVRLLFEFFLFLPISL